MLRVNRHLFLFTFGLCVPFLLDSCSSQDERIQPKTTSIIESVYSSVTIQPDSIYEAYSAVTGIVDRNLVEEGDVVFRGTPLVQIINTNPKINAENARLTLDLAKNNLNGNTALLNNIHEEIIAAKLKLRNDSISYFRQKKLWSRQIGSKAEYDAKKLNYELSKNSAGILNDKYFQTKMELETQLKQAQNNYKTALVTSKDFNIKSKIDGKVYGLYKNPGEIVTTMEPIALLGSASIFIIEMLVDEVDIINIKEGQKVFVSLDAYDNGVFIAFVKKIYPRKDKRNQTFKVEAIFEDPPEILYPGLAGEANIIVAHKSESLVIPKEYVFNDNFVETEEGPTEIEIGLQTMDSLEVIKGITKNTWIYKPKK